MAPQRPRESLDSWLRQRVASSAPGERLPTNAQLARTWHLSQTTVRTVLHALRDEGLVVSTPGRGTIAAPTEPNPDTTLHPPQSSSESLVQTLSHAIGRGDLKRGDPLPQVKAMCVQYHVTPTTVAAAYRSLMERGLVARVGKRYWVGSVSQVAEPVRWRDAVFFYHDDQSLEDFLKRMMWRPGLDELEAELQACRVKLSYAPCSSLHERWEHWRGTRTFPAGLVVASNDTPYVTDTVEWLTSARAPRGIRAPRIVIAGAKATRLRRGLHYFTHGHVPTMRARRVAEFCCEHSFRNLWVCTGFPRHRMSAERDALRLVPEIATRSPNTALRLVVPRSDRVHSPRGFLDALASHHSPRYLLALAGKHRSTSFHELAELVSMVDSLDNIVRDVPASTLLYSLGADQAADMLQSCREHGIAVPQHASILSDSDEQRYYHLGLSSCKPDWRTIGYLMAHALIGDIPIERSSRGFIRTNALIVERTTTP